MIQAAIALRTFLLPMTSTRSFRIGAVVFALTLGLVGLAALARPVADFLARASLDHLRQGTILPGVPLAALLLSEMPLRDGIRQRTLLYPLLGPVSRTLLAVTRTLATAVLVAVALGALVLLIRIVQEGAEQSLASDLLAVALGSLAYVGIFGTVHLVSRRGLLIGLAFHGLLDDPLSRLPFALRYLSPAYHVRVVAQQESLIDLPIPIAAAETEPWVSAVVLLAVAAGFIALTAALFNRKSLGELC